MPVEATDQTTRIRYIRLTASPFVTVGDLLGFADRLRAEAIPLRERIAEHRSNETQHLIGLSVRITEEHPTPRVAARPERKP
jgi:hypothetical protein